MLQLPMIPGWDRIHPLLIHFPLTLFFLAPLFALGAAFTKAATRRAFLVSALLIMILGILSMYAAFEAGGAATKEDLSKEAQAIIERHRELAELTRSSFVLATVLVALMLVLCNSLHLRVHELTGVLPLAALVFYALGLLWLIHAAYQGERLVHEFGVGKF
jgi:uncharacterized membrane protein